MDRAHTWGNPAKHDDLETRIMGATAARLAWLAQRQARAFGVTGRGSLPAAHSLQLVPSLLAYWLACTQRVHMLPGLSATLPAGHRSHALPRGRARRTTTSYHAGARREQPRTRLQIPVRILAPVRGRCLASRRAGGRGGWPSHVWFALTWCPAEHVEHLSPYIEHVPLGHGLVRIQKTNTEDETAGGPRQGQAGGPQIPLLSTVLHALPRTEAGHVGRFRPAVSGCLMTEVAIGL